MGPATLRDLQGLLPEPGEVGERAAELHQLEGLDRPMDADLGDPGREQRLAEHVLHQRGERLRAVEALRGAAQEVVELVPHHLGGLRPLLRFGGDAVEHEAFETGRDVWIMNADGSGKRKIDRKDSHADINPYWAPNGKLVFEGGVADSSIIVMEPDGSERRVVGLEGSTERQPTMRQDGAIVFLSDKGQNGDEWHNIFTMDSNGENLKKLTQDGTYNYSPCWSPDGKKIVFSTWLGENQEIQVMDADGSNLKRLTNTPKSDYDPYWAPDGRIVFVSDRDNTNGNKNELGEIYIMNADGTGQKRLTWNRWVDRNPTLDSKGRLVFQTNPTYGPLKSRGRFGIGMLQVK